MNVKLLVDISVLFTYLAFIVGLIRYRYFTREIKTFFYFVVFGVITEIYTRFHQHFIAKITTPIGHFYFPIAFLILAIFYMQVLENFIKPVYFIIIISVFELYCILNPIFIQSLYEYSSLVGAVGALFVFLFSVAFFIKVVTEAKIEKLSHEPLIWINTALLVYYSFNFLFFALYNLRILASMKVAVLAAVFFSIFNLLFYLIISVGFFITKKKQVKSKHFNKH